MSRRLQRLHRLASLREEQARAVAAVSAGALRSADAAIADARAGTSGVGAVDPRLGRHLLDVGHRRIEHLTAEREVAARAAAADLGTWHDAKRQQRSTERLLERARERARVEADRHDRNELLDLVTARVSNDDRAGIR